MGFPRLKDWVKIFEKLRHSMMGSVVDRATPHHRVGNKRVPEMPSAPKIPFNKPFIAGKELYYIAQAVTLGNISGDGHYTQECSRLLEERFGIRRVLMTPSCTAALEMAAMLLHLGPGDEVIMPSFTFVSTA